MKSEKQMAQAAAAFAERWQDRGDEKSESQSFWTDLLENVFGVEDVTHFIRYEERVKVDKTNFIDGHIPSTRVLIEQKSAAKDLRKGIEQSDGSVLNPFQQAKKYVAGLPLSQHPRWIVTCNFREFLVYDMEQPNGEPQQIMLKDLGKEYYRLMFLVNEKSEHITKEEQVSFEAGRIVAVVHEALMRQYLGAASQTDERLLYRWLNILCVRIVFCLYAEDAGAFTHDQFHDYLLHYPAEDLRRALIELFEVLNTPPEQRSPYLKDELKAFPYTNGGLFEEKIEIPQFTEDLRNVLLQNASRDFDWSEISPTIFGAVFESTLNPETRRSGGMHYTSIENIHKVIDSLFLNALRRELDDILEERIERQRQRRLDAFQEKLASLTFLDPACGSGNFLTETYLSLRRLENEVIRERYHGQSFFSFDLANIIKVSIGQFYGIEINDFAVAVATTALWISEAQMLRETERIIKHDLEFLPLKSYSNIREGNALCMEWQTTDFIMGNPPFVGARVMSGEQKQDVLNIFGEKWKNVGNLDYVGCWYKKAAELLKASPATRAALVSTNSICQGEQVAALWEPLMADGLSIDFAHRTFRWDSEAKLKAHVHCVIVGFSYCKTLQRTIYDGQRVEEAANINAYLLDAPDIFIGSRQHPLCDVPEIGMGNQPIDGGNYLFTKDEMEAFVQLEPKSAAYFHPFYGAYEFINQRPRYCLWLGDCSPAELRQMPHCMKRIEVVRDLRLASSRTSTRKLADRPTHFQTENFPKGDYIVIPEVSSEKRRYIPMGVMSDDVICSNKLRIMPNVSLYHFGILQSNVHMAWMRAVAGRLEMRYDYSIAIVYNNFPWPAPTEEQRQKIERTAQAILDARALYPDSSLADLYDDLTMPPELRTAHQENDRAVMRAYGFDVRTMTESVCVAQLFRLYDKAVRGV